MLAAIAAAVAAVTFRRLSCQKASVVVAVVAEQLTVVVVVAVYLSAVVVCVVFVVVDVVYSSYDFVLAVDPAQWMC